MTHAKLLTHLPKPIGDTQKIMTSGYLVKSHVKCTSLILKTLLPPNLLFREPAVVVNQPYRKKQEGRGH